MAGEANNGLADRFHMDIFEPGRLDVADGIGTAGLVMVERSMTGRHGGELAGAQRSGRPVEVSGSGLFRIDDDKIAKARRTRNQLGLTEHFGAIPAPAQGGAMDYIDPVEVSPGNYKPLFENDHVRVLEMRLDAGEIDDMHSHPSETVYFVQGGTLRVHLPDADALDLEVPDRGVIWHEPWTHRVENAGTSDILAIIVENKTEENR